MIDANSQSGSITGLAAAAHSHADATVAERIEPHGPPSRNERDGSKRKTQQGEAILHSGPPALPAEHSFAFGSFRLYPQQRLLLERSRPVRLSSRGFEILTALVERAGEVISKQDLIARVWRNVTVAEANLKAQVAALRRTLRDGRTGSRYICTVTSRGYCFIAPARRFAVSIDYALTDRPALPAEAANAMVYGCGRGGGPLLNLWHRHFVRSPAPGANRADPGDQPPASP
jgi:DNA-binding winged helix-turn-helix (wHTH) protein